jgi:hypothetical protein
MTKVIISAVFACLCLPAGALDWELPVFTLRYELAHGIREDPEEELVLPSSLRNTASLRIKEVADPAVFDLTLRFSQKDYFMTAGDYGLFELQHEQTWRMNDAFSLGFLLGAKKVDFPEPDSDGWVKDYLSFKVGPTATMKLGGGTRIDGSVAARYDLAENQARSFQAYVLSTGVTSRLEGWQLTARYRGEFRLPFDQASAVGQLLCNTCSLTLQWDPSK